MRAGAAGRCRAPAPPLGRRYRRGRSPTSTIPPSGAVATAPNSPALYSAHAGRRHRDRLAEVLPQHADPRTAPGQPAVEPRGSRREQRSVPRDRARARVRPRHHGRPAPIWRHLDHSRRTVGRAQQHVEPAVGRGGQVGDRLAALGQIARRLGDRRGDRRDRAVDTDTAHDVAAVDAICASWRSCGDRRRRSPPAPPGQLPRVGILRVGRSGGNGARPCALNRARLLPRSKCVGPPRVTRDPEAEFHERTRCTQERVARVDPVARPAASRRRSIACPASGVAVPRQRLATDGSRPRLGTNGHWWRGACGRTVEWLAPKPKDPRVSRGP